MDLCVIALYFKNPRFLTTSFTAITLMTGATHDAHASDVSETDIAEIEASRQLAINHNANSPDDSLLGVPNEVLMEILWSLDPESLAAAAQTSKGLAEVIAAPHFQRHYCPLTANEYVAIVTQLPELFGEEIGGRLQKFLLDKPMNAYWRDLAGLIDPENLALLQAKKGALLRRFFTIKIKDEDGDWSPLPLAKALTISSYAKGIFTANMNGYIQQMKICALAPLSTDQIAVVSAHHNQLIPVTIIDDYFEDTIIKAAAFLTPDQIAAVAAHADQLFPADMESYGRSSIIEDLAPLSTEEIADFAQSVTEHRDQLFTKYKHEDTRFIICRGLVSLVPDQIAVVASHADQLIPADMGPYDRIIIIRALAPFSPDQITGFAGRLDAEDSLDVRLEKIETYTEELRAAGELREQQVVDAGASSL